MRRRSRDTIEIDRHRQEALSLRGRTRTRPLPSGGRLAAWGPLIGTAAIIAAYVLIVPRTPVPSGASAMLISAPVSLMSD